MITAKQLGDALVEIQNQTLEESANLSTNEIKIIVLTLSILVNILRKNGALSYEEALEIKETVVGNLEDRE